MSGRTGRILAERLAREKARFDDAAGLEQGLDAQVAALLDASPRLRFAIDALGPVAGDKILDIACGTGASSVALAAAGAEVVGVDISSASVAMARERANRLGLSDRCRFVESPIEDFIGDGFNALFGAFALHHLDLDMALPVLSRALRPGGRFSFLETSAANPILMFARRNMAGRVGIPKFGSADEAPLGKEGLRKIREQLGPLAITYPDFAFFQLFGLYFGWKIGRAEQMTRLGVRIDNRLDRFLPVRQWTYWFVLCGRR